MSTILAMLRRHSVLSYYVLTFILSWGGILLVVGGPGAVPGTPEQVQRLYPLAIFVMILVPTVMGLLFIALVHGRSGLRDFVARLLRWRVGIQWYAIALLTVPLTVMATLFSLSLISPVYLPNIVTADNKVSLILTGILVGIVGGFLEEVGWTGFAIPQLRQRYSILATGLIVGVLWGTWHLLITFWMSGDSAGVSPLTLFLPSLVASYGELPAYRVVMVWVHDRTQSLLLAVLMHASLIASTLYVLNSATAGSPAVIWHLVWAVVLWAIIAAVGMADRGQPSHQPLSSRPA